MHCSQDLPDIPHWNPPQLAARKQGDQSGGNGRSFVRKDANESLWFCQFERPAALRKTLLLVIACGKDLGTYQQRLHGDGNVACSQPLADEATAQISGALPPDAPPVVITTASIGAGLLFLVPVAVVAVAVQGPPTVTLPGALALLYLSLGASALTTFLWNYAIRQRVGGRYVSVVGLIMAVASGEHIGAVQLAGGLLALAGVWLAERKVVPAGERPRPVFRTWLEGVSMLPREPTWQACMTPAGMRKWVAIVNVRLARLSI